MIQLNSDLIELLAGFEKNGVRYLIIGGYAVSYHAEPRYTKYCDIWVATDRKNAVAVHRTLVEFGAALQGVTARDFEDRNAFFVFGAPPNRIDILLSPPGARFFPAWRRRVTESVGGVQVHFVGRKDLIALKTASGRPIDKRAIRALSASDPARSDLRRKKVPGQTAAAALQNPRTKRPQDLPIGGGSRAHQNGDAAFCVTRPPPAAPAATSLP